MGRYKDKRREIDEDIKRITDKPDRGYDMRPIQVRLSGPKHFFRDDDSVHILEFLTGTGRKDYRNSVPLTTAELRMARQAITDWLGDNYGPRATAG